MRLTCDKITKVILLRAVIRDLRKFGGKSRHLDCVLCKAHSEVEPRGRVKNVKGWLIFLGEALLSLSREFGIHTQTLLAFMPTGPGYVPTFYKFTYLPGILIYSSLSKTKSVCHLIQG